MDMTVVLIGVLVLVVAAFFFLRKKPEELTSGKPSAKPELPEKREAPAKPDAKAPGKGPEAIELPSAEVLPAADSLPHQPLPATKAKRDVAGLRKGLAATRGGFIARLTALVTGKKEIDPAILEQIEEDAVLAGEDLGQAGHGRAEPSV
jgi:fused signal recognition particle receptor